MYKSFFSTAANIHGKSIIRNMNVPSCVDCVFFDRYNSQDKWCVDEKIVRLSKCKKFGVKNVVSGEIQYDYAYKCRNDNEMCKLNGVFFSRKV